MKRKKADLSVGETTAVVHSVNTFIQAEFRPYSFKIRYERPTQTLSLHGHNRSAFADNQ